MVAVGRNSSRNPTIDDVHRAAAGLPSIEEDRRATQDLDPLGGERINGDRVIGRGVRDVDRADPVGENANAVPLKTAKHGTGSVGAERGGGDTGQLVERVADRGTQIARQLLSLEDRGARKRVALAAILFWGTLIVLI